MPKNYRIWTPGLLCVMPTVQKQFLEQNGNYFFTVDTLEWNDAIRLPCMMRLLITVVKLVSRILDREDNCTS